jgi:hypothetical protein
MILVIGIITIMVVVAAKLLVDGIEATKDLTDDELEDMRDSF